MCPGAFIYDFETQGDRFLLWDPGSGRSGGYASFIGGCDKDTSEGYNVIRIQDGSVYVSEADCQNQICVKSAPISTNSQVISCLPHGLIIRVVGTDEEVDSIAYW